MITDEINILEYYFNKYEKGKSDVYLYGKKGVKVGQFNIGQGDIEMFPSLFNIAILFIYPWKSLLSIHRDTIKRKGLYE